MHPPLQSFRGAGVRTVATRGAVPACVLVVAEGPLDFYQLGACITPPPHRVLKCFAGASSLAASLLGGLPENRYFDAGRHKFCDGLRVLGTQSGRRVLFFVTGWYSLHF